MPTTMWGHSDERDGSARGAAEAKKRLRTLKNVGKEQVSAISLLRLNTSPSQKGPSRPDIKPASETNRDKSSTDSEAHAYRTLYRATPCPGASTSVLRLSRSLVTTQKKPKKVVSRWR